MVVGAGGLASPSPFLGAVYAFGFFVAVRLFRGRRGRGLGILLPFLGCRSQVSCASLRSESGGLFFPLSVFSERVLYLRSRERSHVLTLILWAVEVVCSEVLFGMFGASLLGVFIGFVFTGCIGARGSCFVARVSCFRVALWWKLLAAFPCFSSRSAPHEECLCFGCCSSELHSAASRRLLAFASQGQALLWN